jgi:topoisomerase IV subunit A
MVEDENLNEENLQEQNQDESVHDVPVTGMYKHWFLEYASYVILERAVPSVHDGLKPVQRRVMHSLKEMDDGRYNKVANVIGHTMKYHPHGDQAIGDAMVNLGQKELLIDMQGNWGDIRTGDGAAAARYIEARLSKFALEVVFNKDTTKWQASYDGRNKEPIDLPVKFPLLLAQGVEGIAVGLATKIMPHNFIELCDASIRHLQGKKFTLYPDFLTGGFVDVSNYNDGLRGGKIRVRAKIEDLDKKTLLIKEIPYGTTTTSIIESIVKANDQGKIKIKKVVDNTAKDVEIEISLAPNVSPDVTIDALYAFTDCEVSISPNACVIVDGNKPHFLGISEILRINTEHTMELLRQELEIKKADLLEKILFSSLEKIFIENRIYRDIEEVDESFEEVINTVDRGLEPYKPQFYRVIVKDDILRLLEIRIKRISKYDSFKADELMRAMEEELKEVDFHLANLVDYSIAYYQRIKEKFGKGRERRTEITNFETIAIRQVVANNAKLYVNYAEGFIGTGLKKDEFVMDCSDIDLVITIREDGKMSVVPISEKTFVGKNIIYCSVWRKNDERMVYNTVYLDGESGRTFVKRFQVLGITRDKDYDLTKGNKRSKILYLTTNPNGEAETVSVFLTANSSARNKAFDFDFSNIEIKGRSAGGNILTRYPIRKVQFKEAGVSTLSGLDIWFDASVGRINRDERGIHIGKFNGEDKILVIFNNGEYELTSFELTNRYDAKNILIITKFKPKLIISALHYHGGNKTLYVKRFNIETTTPDKKFSFIDESAGSRLEFVSVDAKPRVSIQSKSAIKGAEPKEVELKLEELIDVKGWKSTGNKITSDKILKLKALAPETEKEDEENVIETVEEDEIEEKGTKATSFKPGDSIDFGSEQLSLF